MFTESEKYALRAGEGGTSPFRNDSNLKLWLDASDSSTIFDATAGGSNNLVDGASIARWEDKSGQVSPIVAHQNHVFPKWEVPALCFKHPKGGNPHRHQECPCCDKDEEENRPVLISFFHRTHQISEKWPATQSNKQVEAKSIKECHKQRKQPCNWMCPHRRQRAFGHEGSSNHRRQNNRN